MSWPPWRHHPHRDSAGPNGPWGRGPWGRGPWGRRAPWMRAALLRLGPAAFLRARLHRRIFAWFGLSILVTGIALGAVSTLMERATGSGWRHEIGRLSLFIGGQLEKVWDRPGERAELARSIERDLDVRVELRDAAGAPIAPFDVACKRPLFDAAVKRDAATLGHARVCLEARASSPRWGWIVPLVAGVVLWAASGRIARRLARPLGDLARVAQDLGQGKLDSRVDIRCNDHGEVGIVAEAMNEMAARIQKQLDDQRELLATVSHELRTPLSRIRLLTEIARDGGDPAHAFDEIDREVVELDQLVGDLLASSRLDFSALTTKEISAAEALERAVSRAGLDPDKVLSVRDADRGSRVAADPTLLARALSNLLDNAARHGGGVTRAVLHVAGGGVAFEVEDSGPGLAEGEEERIFEAFYQGSAGPDGAPKKGALGLGLALVRRIAEAHGGRAFAENRSGGGARVVLELPSRPAPIVASTIR